MRVSAFPWRQAVHKTQPGTRAPQTAAAQRPVSSGTPNRSARDTTNKTGHCQGSIGGGGGGWDPNIYVPKMAQFPNGKFRVSPQGHFGMERGGEGAPRGGIPRSNLTEEQGTVQGPVKKEQPDGLSHGGYPPSSYGHSNPPPPPCAQCAWDPLRPAPYRPSSPSPHTFEQNVWASYRPRGGPIPSADTAASSADACPPMPTGACPRAMDSHGPAA